MLMKKKRGGTGSCNKYVGRTLGPLFRTLRFETFGFQTPRPLALGPSDTNHQLSGTLTSGAWAFGPKDLKPLPLRPFPFRLIGTWTLEPSASRTTAVKSGFF